MNGLLAQIVVAARNRDGEDTGWMQLLIFVILAAFYGLASIIKAKGGKVELEEDKQLERAFAVKKQPRSRVQPSRRKITRPQPAVRKTAAEKPQEPFERPIKELEIEELGILGETPQPQTIIEEPLLDFDDPDELRRAILHYEILGKPLSLRGPAG